MNEWLREQIYGSSASCHLLQKVIPVIYTKWRILTSIVNRSLYMKKIITILKELYFIPPIPAMEKEMATHSSILACRIPWTEEPGGLQSTGSQRVGHDWATSLTHSYLHEIPKIVSPKYFNTYGFFSFSLLAYVIGETFSWFLHQWELFSTPVYLGFSKSTPDPFFLPEDVERQWECISMGDSG